MIVFTDTPLLLLMYFVFFVLPSMSVCGVVFDFLLKKVKPQSKYLATKKFVSTFPILYIVVVTSLSLLAKFFVKTDLNLLEYIVVSLGLPTVIVTDLAMNNRSQI